jgi:ribosomal protein S18 acetylase RimI-like enzyme
MKIIHSEDYIINDSIERIDFDQVRNMLKNAFWSKDIGIEEIRKGASNSALVVAAYYKDDSIAGYLRVISDKTRFAYILDVYVDEPHRRKGLARSMVRFALNHPDLSDVYQWILITRDAHDVYRGVGFQPLPEPDKWMCIIKQRPDR